MSKCLSPSVSVALAVSLLSVGACSGLFSNLSSALVGSPEVVRVSSDPGGAAVTIEGELVGYTPLEVQLDVAFDHEVIVEAAGYPAETRLIRSIDAPALSGQMYTLEPTELHFQFSPSAPATSTTVNEEQRRAPQTSTESSGGSSSQQHCCLNNAFYECPDLNTLRRCAPPELAPCMMNCGMDMSCPDQCLQRYPTDPSGCTRDPSRDRQCGR